MEYVLRMTVLNNIICLLFIIVLIIASIQDISKQSVSMIWLYALVGMALVRCIENIAIHNVNLWLILGTVLVSLALVLADCKGIKILGGADLIIICSLSALFDTTNFFMMLIIAFLTAFVMSVLLILVGKVGKRDTMPFIPMITFGVLAVTLCNMITGR